MNNDTIAALATPPGRGGVGVVRISGPAVKTIAESVLGSCPEPRQAVLKRFLDADANSIDSGLALFFPGPNSFTGEDVLELQGHGGRVVMDMLLARLYELGARPARPGEFSERAFLNDKIDLAQAEAIADLIDSGSNEAARAAMRSLQGEFSQRVKELAEQMLYLRMYVEAAIDFPEEEIDFLADTKLQQRIVECQQSMQSLLADTEQGCVLREGLVLVIAGLPNAGKSSLLNALAGRDTAIVTDIPGTTRDVLREHIQLNGLPLEIIDTAGLRDSDDSIEKEGVKRAWAEIEQADRLLFVVDENKGIDTDVEALLARLPKTLPRTIVHNKIDLAGHDAGIQTDAEETHVYVSAKTGRGLDELSHHLQDCAGYREAGSDSFSARRRHLEALRRAAEWMDKGVDALQLQQAGELVAEDLRLAHQEMGSITGDVSSDDLLGEIFSSFCIGK